MLPLSFREARLLLCHTTPSACPPLHAIVADAPVRPRVLRAFADFFTIQVCDALVMSERSTWARDATKYYKNAIVPVVKIKVGKVPAWCR